MCPIIALTFSIADVVSEGYTAAASTENRQLKVKIIAEWDWLAEGLPARRPSHATTMSAAEENLMSGFVGCGSSPVLYCTANTAREMAKAETAVVKLSVAASG